MTIQEYPVIMWGVLATAFIVILILHWTENKKLKEKLLQQLDAESVGEVINFAWSRTIQFLALIIIIFVLIGIYDWKLSNMLKDIKSYQDAQIIETIIKINNPDTGNDLNNTNCLETDELNEKKLLQPEISSKNTIQDIFGIIENGSASNRQIENIKTHYEELIVNYMFMQKCGKVDSNDYQIIISALQNEIVSANAQPSLQDDIITAAKGSYDEIYSHSSCSESSVESTSIQYRNYLKTLLNRNTGK